MLNKLILIVLISIISGCTIINEELRIANGLVTLKVIDNKPKVRLASGLEDCRWRARVQVHDLDNGNHEVWFICKIPFSM